MSEDQSKHPYPKLEAVSKNAKTALLAPKKEKFDFDKMKTAATSDDRLVRKAEFIEYFERFNEFPSFLFDNEQGLDPRLAATMQDLSKDENSSQALMDGVKALLCRLPS